MPPQLMEKLKDLGWKFYTFIGAGGARLLCSWETREEEIDALVADVAGLVA